MDNYRVLLKLVRFLKKFHYVVYSIVLSISCIIKLKAFYLFYLIAMYHVVSFPDTKEVEVVSAFWLSDDEKNCYWPPFKASTRITNAVKNHLRPEDNLVA